jgi:integrase/recombinase XerD
MELGTPPKLIGDILGHRDPESTSAYLRVSTEGLRQMALPVPR